MTTLYGIVDTAQDERLYDWVKATPERESLFAGKLDPVLERSSPFILNLDKAPGFLARWDTEGRGENWGIKCFSERPLKAVRRHLRHFLQAKLPDGRVVLFRFYDPRVWHAYIRTCNPAELASWFSGFDEVIAEEPEGTEVVWFLIGEQLRQSRRLHNSAESAKIWLGNNREAIV